MGSPNVPNIEPLSSEVPYRTPLDPSKEPVKNPKPLTFGATTEPGMLQHPGKMHIPD